MDLHWEAAISGGLDSPAHENPLLLKIQPDMIKELNVPDYIL